MHQPRIPVRPSSLIRFPSRRDLLRGLISVGLALPIARPPDSAAKKKHKRKSKKKVKRNAFGCVNVGKFCKNHGQCCSGICKGWEPGDKKFCRAHDQSTCEAGQSAEVCGGSDVPCLTSGGGTGRCVTTTGNAGYCYEQSGHCFACRRDADCVPLGGPQAACVLCAASCMPLGVQTACVGPEIVAPSRRRRPPQTTNGPMPIAGAMSVVPNVDWGSA
jgi:hypothetical protein